MKRVVPMLLIAGAVAALDYEQPRGEMTTKAIETYARECWCGGGIGRYTVDGTSVLVLSMTRTSGIDSSELYVYKAINEDLWLQVAHLPLIAMAHRQVASDGHKLIVTQYGRNGPEGDPQDVTIK